MTEYSINVSEVEELQMTSKLVELEQMFTRAQSTIMQGGSVYLVRQNADGSKYKFDELTTEDEIGNYKETVFKYL
ncbi:MAG: hypothetical protein JWQ40_3017 [Segetibacter sp.]|jgi:hypothetical protein|nr:hypothetical protein [Segetibacter sp.]